MGFFLFPPCSYNMPGPESHPKNLYNGSALLSASNLHHKVTKFVLYSSKPDPLKDWWSISIALSLDT